MLFTSLNGKLMLATHKDVAQRVTNPFFYEMEEDLANMTLRLSLRGLLNLAVRPKIHNLYFKSSSSLTVRYFFVSS